jgi:ParB family transcriptional regulator, chromosome partitioning protein
MVREIREIEIGLLHLRYAHTRIERARERLALAASLERLGQIVPVTVTTTFVLLDGYLRVKALTHLGRDTVRAEIWDCTEEEALVELLARAHGRKWDALEEAALLAELHDRCHLSQEKIASMVGRTQGWVSSRLALYGALSEDLIALIRRGSLSTWTAARVIAPIARAIPAHGTALAESLSRTPLSTREMALFFRHYQKATRTQREHMVRDPSLFFKSLRARHEARDAKALKEGPEGAWLKDLTAITHMLARVRRTVPALFPRGQSNLDRQFLLTAFEESKEQFIKLEHEIRRHDDHRRDEAGNHESSRTGSPHPADRRDPESIPERGQAGDTGDLARPAAAVPLRGALVRNP